MPRRLLLATLAGLALAAPAGADTIQRQVLVTGSAQVETVPDRATVSAGVETDGADAADALHSNAAAMTAVFAALDAAKVDRRDVQTSQLSLNPVYDTGSDGSQPSPPKVTGYHASNMVTVRVRDIDTLGAIIDTVTAAGANRLYGVGFDVSDPQATLDSARQKAVSDARAKAELFAKAAGATLGQVLSIREGGGMGQPGPLFARAGVAGAPPVAEGTVTLTADVEIVYALE